MRKFDKLLLLIVSLICCIGSFFVLSLFYYIPVVTALVEESLTAYPWLKDVIAVFSLFLCICFLLLLLLALFSPIKVGTIYFKRSRGIIYFTKQAIESAVRYSYADIAEISSSRVRLTLRYKPEKMRVYVKLSVNDSGKLADLTDVIQEKIESAVKQSFGITIKSINIEVVEIKNERTDDKEKGGESRVI